MITQPYYDITDSEKEYIELLQSVKKQDFPDKLLLDNLHLKKYTLKDANTSYRTINRWSTLGLLLEMRPVDKKLRLVDESWRRFSTVDLIWISIIVELRKFGVTSDVLDLVKQHLFDSQLSLMPLYFDYYTIQALKNKKIILIVGQRGQSFFINKEYISKELISKEEIFNFLYIDFHRLVNNISTHSNHIILNLDYLMELKPEELDLIAKLRSGKYEKISISDKNGSKKIEYVIAHTSERRIKEFLKDYPYQDMHVTVYNGKPIKVTQIIKKNYE